MECKKLDANLRQKIEHKYKTVFWKNDSKHIPGNQDECEVLGKLYVFNISNDGQHFICTIE